MANPVTDTEYAEIATTLHEGATCGAAARKHGRAKGTIRRIADEEGIDFARAATKKATEARQRYDEAERREVLNEGFDKARELLKDITEPADLQKWTVALGTLVDKVRLEGNQATDRSEVTHNQGLDLQEEFQKLDRELEG